TPIGTCMVSSEGACAAYYKYGRLSTMAKRDKSGVSSEPISV
ncbi:MAG: hydrogenase formation protein HypD, partial [Dolichospermum sp.]